MCLTFIPFVVRVFFIIMSTRRMIRKSGYKKPNLNISKFKVKVAFDGNSNRSLMYKSIKTSSTLASNVSPEKSRFHRQAIHPVIQNTNETSRIGKIVNMDENKDKKITEHVTDSVIGNKCTNIVETSGTIEFKECNLHSPSPDLKNTIHHLRNLNDLKGKDLACRKVLWPADDTNLTKSNNYDDKIHTQNVESIDELLSSESEPYSASSDEEYKPESASDSDEHAVNVDFNETRSTACMDIWSENLTDIDVNKSSKINIVDNKKSVQGKTNPASNLKKGVTAAGIARKYDKKTCCAFCQELVLKFPRHLIRKHRNEKEVEELCSLPPRDSKRINILSKLRKLGNFQYNSNTLENKEGNIIVKRRSQEARKAENYLPCHICLGYYAKRNLYMHYKRCHSEEDDKSNRIQKAGRALLPVRRSHASDLLAKKILPDLRNDNISEIIRNDRLILLFGSDLALKLCREQHLSSHVRQRMRELARLVEHIKDLDHTFDQLENLFHPQNTELFFKALTNLTQLDVSSGTYMKPSAAIKLRTSLYVCGEILMGLSVQDENKRINIQHFLTIINLKFKRYCSLAKQTIDESKWNKPVNLPSSENIKHFMVYLDREQAHLYKKLSSIYNYNTWNRLSKVLLVNLLVFNRRRAGEAQMLKVSEFDKRHAIEKHSDLYNMLTDVEKQVSDNYCRVQVRGKLRNGVPILLTNFQVKIIKLLLNNRSKAHVSETNPYVFGRLTKSFLRATDAIRQLTEESGVKEPEKIRSTTLRKQLSTQVQILNLKDNELDDLAGSLGHDIRVHRSFYRLPDHMVQIAKTGKLLVAASQDRILESQGCTLDQININLNEKQYENQHEHIIENENELEINTDCLYNEFSSNNKEIQNVIDKKLNDEPSSEYRVARSKARWNTPEKNSLKKRFKQHLQKFKVPGKLECEEAIHNESPLKKKNWRDIKNWVHNTNVSTRRKQKDRINMPLN